MYNVLEKFLKNSQAENFEPIRHNSYLLAKVLREDEDLAKIFFGFNEWFLIYKETKDLDIREKAIIQDGLKSTISCFNDAIKYYYSLSYDDRITWQQNFIDHAETVQNLEYVLNQVNKEYRTQIVEKMQKIAYTDEDKKIAFSYTI